MGHIRVQFLRAELAAQGDWKQPLDHQQLDPLPAANVNFEKTGHSPFLLPCRKMIYLNSIVHFKLPQCPVTGSSTAHPPCL